MTHVTDLSASAFSELSETKKRRSDYQFGTKVCEVCGTVFSRPANWPAPAWRRTRFCSRDCSYIGKRRPKNTLDNFFDRIVPEPNSGCWLWIGYLNTYGYGKFRMAGRAYYAHRLSFEVAKGPIPTGLLVLHTCDTRCCVNPDHLYSGTEADNSRDAAERNRLPRGESHHGTNLTDDQVRQIRIDVGATANLANRFGVSSATIRKIRNGRTWGHVQ
jgi:hypothetical protein